MSLVKVNLYTRLPFNHKGNGGQAEGTAGFVLKFSLPVHRIPSVLTSFTSVVNQVIELQIASPNNISATYPVDYALIPFHIIMFVLLELLRQSLRRKNFFLRNRGKAVVCCLI